MTVPLTTAPAGAAAANDSITEQPDNELANTRLTVRCHSFRSKLRALLPFSSCARQLGRPDDLGPKVHVSDSVHRRPAATFPQRHGRFRPVSPASNPIRASAEYRLPRPPG
jgi:hypothetical protein